MCHFSQMMLWQFRALDCHALPGASASQGFQGQSTLFVRSHQAAVICSGSLQRRGYCLCMYPLKNSPLFKRQWKWWNCDQGKHRAAETIKSFSQTKLFLAPPCLLCPEKSPLFLQLGCPQGISDRSPASVPSSQWRPRTPHNASCFRTLLFKFILVFIFGS